MKPPQPEDPRVDGYLNAAENSLTIALRLSKHRKTRSSITRLIEKIAELR